MLSNITFSVNSHGADNPFDDKDFLTSLNSKTLWLCVLILVLVLSRGMIRIAGRRSARRDVANNHAVIRTEGRLAKLPHIILWAWERPEKLDFIDKDKAGVAFLAKTLYLRGERVVSRPRLQPLAVSQGTALVAVARIEPSVSEPAFTLPRKWKAQQAR